MPFHAPYSPTTGSGFIVPERRTVERRKRGKVASESGPSTPASRSSSKVLPNPPCRQETGKQNLPQRDRPKQGRLRHFPVDIWQDSTSHWLDAAMDLILSERQGIGTVYFMMNEENVKLELRQPWIKFGTDAEGVNPENSKGLTHPRSYGTFPRILGKYVREERVIPLEDAIRKMTSAVAARLSIRDRGLLRQGFHADVVIFDPVTIADRATFEKPHQVSVGVRHVLVNGTAVIREGRHTGAKPGQIVRGPGYVSRPAAGSPATDAVQALSPAARAFNRENTR